MQEQVRGGVRPPFVLVLVGIVAVALSLRGPIVSVTPVLRDIQGDLGLGSTAVGLLATAPILAFAVASPAAALLTRRLGPEVAVVLTLVGTLVSQLVRAVPATGTVVLGTVLLGLSITVGNVCVPVVIQRDVDPARVGTVTGAYTAVMNIGSLLTALLTAPLAERFGWPVALALWAVLPAAGLVVWSVLLRRQGGLRRASMAVRTAARTTGTGPAEPSSGGDGAPPALASRPVMRIPATWILAVAFAAQAFSYYSYTAWLPTYLADETGAAATSAGALASTFQAFGVLGGFLVPVLARLTDLRWTAAAVGAGWLVLSLGVALDPAHVDLWLVVGGTAQAGGFTVVFTGVSLAARDSRETGGMSAVVQSLGYLVAASGGPVVGALHSATGGWTVPLWVLVGTTTTFAVMSLVAAVHVTRLRRPEPAEDVVSAG